MIDTPTPAPLTDEQIERYAGIYRQIAVDAVGFPKVDADVRETFDTWLAAVIAKAKREKAEEVAQAIERRRDRIEAVQRENNDGYVPDVVSLILAGYSHCATTAREATDDETR